MSVAESLRTRRRPGSWPVGVPVRRALKVPTLRAGVLLMGGMLALSVLGSVALPDPNKKDLLAALAPPGTSGHLLGADPVGRDLLAWVAAGIRTSLLVSVGVVALSATVGTLVGMLSGYRGGLADAIIMRIVDMQLAVPPVLFFIAAAAVIRPSVTAVVLLLSAVAWVPYARIVRAHVLSERERAFVAAARLAGSRPLRIMTFHLLPSVATIVAVFASLQAGYVLLWEAALSFLGLGVQPPTESLGFMISQGKDVLATAWWITVVPGIAVVLLALAFNTIGDGLRELFHLDEDEVLGR